MNCQECQDLLDNLLVTEPSEAEHAAIAEHLEECPDCARQYAQAKRALAAITPNGPFPVSHDFKERIMSAISEARVSRPMPTVAPRRRVHAWKAVAAIGVATALLVAAVSFLRSGPESGGLNGSSAFGLLSEAYGAEAGLFAGNQMVHLVNEITVVPVADATMAEMRWLPLLSLEATGKPRFNQLSLPAEVGKGYTVEDQSWYDPATGRFVRVLTSGGKPIFANSYDGTNVYSLETLATGQMQVVKHPIGKDFQAPKNPAEFLGIAAGLKSTFDTKEKSAEHQQVAPSEVSDAGKVTIAEGVDGRVVKVGFSEGGPKEAKDSFWLFTIREDNNTIEKMEWRSQEQSLLVIRRSETESGQGPSMGWDLAGLATAAPNAAAVPGPTVAAGMIVPDVSVEHMVEKADFSTYVFSKAPSWAGEREIIDCLDVASPPHRMFLTTYRAKDGRHVVFAQTFTFNKMLGLVVKTGKVVYTSPSGIKVWSGPRDEWLANILLSSAQASIKDQPGKELTGYVLETPAGTFPALAINGKVSEEELHSLIDSLTLAK